MPTGFREHHSQHIGGHVFNVRLQLFGRPMLEGGVVNGSTFSFLASSHTRFVQSMFMFVPSFITLTSPFRGYAGYPY